MDSGFFSLDFSSQLNADCFHLHVIVTQHDFMQTKQLITFFITKMDSIHSNMLTFTV